MSLFFKGNANPLLRVPRTVSVTPSLQLLVYLTIRTYIIFHFRIVRYENFIRGPHFAFKNFFIKNDEISEKYLHEKVRNGGKNLKYLGYLSREEQVFNVSVSVVPVFQRGMSKNLQRQ